MYTNITLPRETWSHVAIQLDSNNQTVIVYVDGSTVYSASIASLLSQASALVNSVSSMSIILFEEALSGIKLPLFNRLWKLILDLI